jgi:hypothetical protein
MRRKASAELRRTQWSIEKFSGQAENFKMDDLVRATRTTRLLPFVRFQGAASRINSFKKGRVRLALNGPHVGRLASDTAGFFPPVRVSCGKAPSSLWRKVFYDWLAKSRSSPSATGLPICLEAPLRLDALALTVLGPQSSSGGHLLLLLFSWHTLGARRLVTGAEFASPDDPGMAIIVK